MDGSFLGFRGLENNQYYHTFFFEYTGSLKNRLLFIFWVKKKESKKLYIFFSSLNMEYTEDHIRKLSTEHGLSKEQIIEFIAEFKAYDTDGNGVITTIDLGIVNKVKLYLNHLQINAIMYIIATNLFLDLKWQFPGGRELGRKGCHLH